MKYYILIIVSLAITRIGFCQSWENIHVDQFGYRTTMKKVATLSNPIVGSNSNVTYIPGPVLQVRDNTNQVIFSGSPEVWNNGATHFQSGDKGWWFDFSSVQTPGTYHIYDPTNDISSAEFEVNDAVYNEVLKAAVRMYYYNRCGIAKEEAYTGPKWTDEISFTQDANARSIFDPTNASLEKDLSGGWYDAGDYNKYIAFMYESMHDLLWAYTENPQIFTDDFNIPESGNGIPDFLDELKWELDWMIKMQNPDGTVHNKMGTAGGDAEGSASPPSINTNTRFYGPTCTSATLTNAGVFAHAALVYSNIAGMESYSSTLATLAEQAWDAVEPNLVSGDFDTDCDNGEIKAGDADRNVIQQRDMSTVAAVYLYALTSDAKYRQYVVDNYTNIEVYNNGFYGPYLTAETDAMLFFADEILTSADAALIAAIKQPFTTAVSNNWQEYFGENETDLYQAHVPDWQYHWGGLKPKANVGIQNILIQSHNLSSNDAATFLNKAAGHLHFMHGLNPQNTVYLTNMYDFGAEKAVNEMYHNWMADGTIYDNALTSPNGPAPGFLVGGPNASYSEAGCCGSNSCGAYGNAKCGTDPSINNFPNEPIMKSYIDFNGDWPFNSWQLSEPSQTYQGSYIRLLANITESPCLPAGTPCDDGDVTTENDIENGLCTCEGTPITSCADRDVVPKAGTASDIIESCTIGEWEHFYDSEDDIIFSIRKGSNDYEFEVDLNVFPTIAETDGVSAGTFVMGRQWNVDVIGGAVDFPDPVSIRFYYNPLEMQDLIQTANDFRNLSPDSINLSGVKWFKTTKGVDFDENMVFAEGLDASQTYELFSVSAETVISPDVHFVQIDDISSFSGGTAFITGGVTVLDIDDELEALAINALNSAVVSPNPSGSDFEITLENIEAFDYELTVTNSLGAMVDQFKPSVNKVRFGSALESGVYYLNISNGVRMITKKLIKI